MKHYKESLQKLEKEKGFSFFRKEESDEVTYLKDKIRKGEMKLEEIDRKLRGDYSKPEGKGKLPKARVLADAEEKVKNIQSKIMKKKNSQGGIAVIVAMVALVSIVAFFMENESLYEENDSFYETDYEEEGMDIEGIVDQYGFDEDTSVVMDPWDEGYIACISVGGYDLELDMAEYYGEEGSITVRLSCFADDEKAPMKIENENVKALMCELVSYACEEDIVDKKTLDEFLAETPEAAYKEGEDYIRQLPNDYYSDISIEYGCDFEEDKRYDTLMIQVIE